MDLDIAAALRHLARTAPESTTFAFTRAGTTFLGATPERLVRTVGRAFETIAIAGSAPRGSDAAEDARLAAALLASEKEREEHAVVVEMLRAGLTPIVDDARIPEAPVILPLRHLQHLVTPISGTMHDEAGLLALADRLHPDAGGRGDAARHGAGADRRARGVRPRLVRRADRLAGRRRRRRDDGRPALRARRGPRATLFAGCGIVADSEPAREWDESRLKLRTMLAALGGLADRVR